MKYDKTKFDIEGTRLKKYKGEDSICIVPDGITHVDSYAFNNEKIIEIKLPESVVWISGDAFRCENLRTINIPDNVTEIGGSAFYGCKNLEMISLSKNLKEIPSFCFAKCENLKQINIPASVQKIKNYAFAECESLTHIAIPEGTKVEKFIFGFEGCIKNTFVELPEKTTVEWNSFAGDKVTVNETEKYYFNKGYAFQKESINADYFNNKNRIFGNRNYVGLKIDGTVAYYKDYEQNESYEDCGFYEWKDIESLCSIGSSYYKRNFCVGINKDCGYIVEGRVHIGLPEDESYKYIEGEDNWSLGITKAGKIITYYNEYEDGSVPGFLRWRYQLTSWDNIKQIVHEDHYIAGLKYDGTVLLLINEEDGKRRIGRDYNLFDVADWQGIKQICGNGLMLYGLKYDGTVVYTGCGYDGDRMLGENIKGMIFRHYDTSALKDIVQIEIMHNCIVGVKQDGTIVVSELLSDSGKSKFSYDIWGKDDIEEIRTWKDIIEFHYLPTIGLKKDGSLILKGYFEGGADSIMKKWKLF